MGEAVVVDLSFAGANHAITIDDLKRGGADDVQSGDIVLDRAAHRVTRRSREVHLGPTEFRLLAFFMENSGRVLSRQQLLAIG